MKKILMATDLSHRADNAMARAAALATSTKAALEIIHVVDETLPDAILDQYEATARATIDQRLAALGANKPQVITVLIQRGVDYADIIARAAESQIDLLVIGLHRHDMPEMFAGTTVERVVRHGHAPVLVVKDAVQGPYRKATAAIDPSPHSLASIALAARLVPNGEIDLLHVPYRPYNALMANEFQKRLVREENTRLKLLFEENIRQLSAELGAAAPKFTLVMQEGEVRQVIREHIRNTRPELLAVGTHGRSGLARAVIGSIAEDFLTRAPIDVLAVKTA